MNYAEAMGGPCDGQLLELNHRGQRFIKVPFHGEQMDIGREAAFKPWLAAPPLLCIYRVDYAGTKAQYVETIGREWLNERGPEYARERSYAL